MTQPMGFIQARLGTLTLLLMMTGTRQWRRRLDGPRRPRGCLGPRFVRGKAVTPGRQNAAAIRERIAVRIAVGNLDSLLVRNRNYHDLLGRLKIEHAYTVLPGVGHDSAEVYGALRRGLCVLSATSLDSARQVRCLG